ncbi:MAG TPA: lipase maturation factor family protein [Gammaproteobacteria bacterium]|nr:lipase maturation factor family protein [Gammaproteobacteria bacterium]
MKINLSLVTSSLQTVDNYRLASGLFIKLLALIYFFAFFSLGIQITGLVGAKGILPLTELLDYMSQNYGAMAWLYKPTLFWIDSSDLALKLLPLLGCIVSLLLLWGIRPLWSLVTLFVLYLSLFHAGQTFLMFQWDTLLLEAGFLAIFLGSGPSHLLLFLFHWLLFRLRFMSGVSKFSSGDPDWLNLTALNHYFETQPLPHVGAWYFHQLPDWLLQGGVLLAFFTELIVPFFIFLPRRFRLFAAAITLTMQLLIIATSNHNWINLLTIALCLFLLDDDILKKILPRQLRRHVSLVDNAGGDKSGQQINRRNYLLPVFAAMILLGSMTAFTTMVSNIKIPVVLDKATTLIRLWGIGHSFHVFPTMQTERHELQIEGSNDGVEWKVYDFRYKPGALDKKPEFIVPHQPRLDWMIWFVPPRSNVMMYWFDRFLSRLHEGSPDVLALLEHDPFPDKPPRYLRVQVYQYWFTTEHERAVSGNWWKRKYLGEFPYVRARYP